MPNLLIAKPDGSLLQEHDLKPRSTLVLGRGADCDVVIPSERISRHHALIFEHHGRWFAVDLDSTAGLSFEDAPVEIHAFETARSWVAMGPVVLWIDDDVPPSNSDAPPPPPVPEGVGAGMPRSGRDVDGTPFLRHADSPRSLLIYFRDAGSGDSRLFDFADADRVTFGRDPRCDLVVDSPETLDLHCLLYREGPLWKLLDLQQIDRGREPERRRRIRMLDGMPVQIGRLKGTVLVPERVVRDGVANLSIGSRLDDGHDAKFTPPEPPNDVFSADERQNDPKH